MSAHVRAASEGGLPSQSQRGIDHLLCWPIRQPLRCCHVRKLCAAEDELPKGTTPISNPDPRLCKRKLIVPFKSHFASRRSDQVRREGPLLKEGMRRGWKSWKRCSGVCVVLWRW